LLVLHRPKVGPKVGGALADLYRVPRHRVAVAAPREELPLGAKGEGATAAHSTGIGSREVVYGYIRVGLEYDHYCY